VKGDVDATPPRKPWSRPYVNAQVHRLCRLFRWGSSHQMLPISVYHELKAVPALRRGKSDARETEPVGPVSMEDIEAVRPFLSRQINALISLQLFCGARGGEILKLRPIDIDMSGDVWTFAPKQHKNAHRGHDRFVYFGPRAQAVIQPFLLDRPVDAYLFPPAEADAERRKARAKARKTPAGHGNAPGTNVVARRAKELGAFYTPTAYRHAIAMACDRAFPHPDPAHQPQIITIEMTKNGTRRRKNRQRLETMEQVWNRLTPEQRTELKRWQKGHQWRPHQLRHAAGKAIRRDLGLEAARVVLGHSTPVMTDHYAERDSREAVEVARRLG
jgi:integrase